MNLGAIAAALLAVGLVAGCSSEEPPTTLPAVEASPSAEREPAAAFIPLPASARAETSQGASAFVGYYLDLLNEAFATGDGRQVDAVSDPGCEGCNNLLDLISRQSSDRRIVGGEYQLVGAATSGVTNGDALVDFSYTLNKAKVVGLDGATIEELPAEGPTKALIRVNRTGDSWAVFGFRLAA